MTKFARWAALTALSLTFSTLAVACGGGDGSPKDDGNGGSGASGASGSGSGASSGTSSSTSNGSTSSGGEECGAGSINQQDACELCVASSCTAQALACCQTPGCLDIISCAQETGCDGINCYTPDTCQDAIDAAGGPNIATQYAMPLGDCAAEKCATECELNPS